MFESEFRIVFWLFAVIAGSIAVITLVGVLFHFAALGAVIGFVLKKIRDTSPGRAGEASARSCRHCGTSMPRGANACPNCGAPSS